MKLQAEVVLKYKLQECFQAAEKGIYRVGKI